MIDVVDSSYEETFIASPNPGYRFVRWQPVKRGLCGGSSESCEVSLADVADNDQLQAFLDSDETFRLVPLFRKKAIADSDSSLTGLWTFRSRSRYLRDSFVGIFEDQRDIRFSVAIQEYTDGSLDALHCRDSNYVGREEIPSSKDGFELVFRNDAAVMTVLDSSNMVGMYRSNDGDYSFISSSIEATKTSNARFSDKGFSMGRASVDITDDGERRRGTVDIACYSQGTQSGSTTDRSFSVDFLIYYAFRNLNRVGPGHGVELDNFNTGPEVAVSYSDIASAPGLSTTHRVNGDGEIDDIIDYTRDDED
ncbi:MAG: hypothetical protein AAGI11_18795, partial [Pseudomonadota bacterium]